MLKLFTQIFYCLASLFKMKEIISLLPLRCVVVADLSHRVSPFNVFRGLSFSTFIDFYVPSAASLFSRQNYRRTTSQRRKLNDQSRAPRTSVQLRTL